MSANQTIQALSTITDVGLFEQLATAILRESNPIYASLVHSGVNIKGKTVKSPLDGICFDQNADPPHMFAFHHTTTDGEKLENKWLHDPSNVKPRKNKKPTAPAGDLIKTAEIVEEERKRTPNLCATLVLTTNEEPDESIVRAVNAAGHVHGIKIDLWSRSRLCHFLDSPKGQWIRRKFLGIKQELLSSELLLEISEKSIGDNAPQDDPSAWIQRSLDTVLSDCICQNVTFLVAGSGLGKSVACFRKLKTYVGSGGYGLILPHNNVINAMSIEQAVISTLCQIHPQLTITGSPLEFCSPERPMLLVLEDVNRSGQARQLVEKLISWSGSSSSKGKGMQARWCIICPLWPETLGLLGDQVKERVEQHILTASGFSESEGQNAVLIRAQKAGHKVSPLSARATARALGHDPLLIALHDPSKKADPSSTISRFVEGAIQRISVDDKDHTAADYRQALRTLAGTMLSDRHLELTWMKLRKSLELKGEILCLLSRLASQGELIGVIGLSGDSRISFRHDRVREWLFADAAADMLNQGSLIEDTVSDPFFAEIMGAVLVWGNPGTDFLQLVSSLNPLALFHALRLLDCSKTPEYDSICGAINRWLDDPATHSKANLHLRWEAMSILAETDSAAVPSIARKFQECNMNTQLARLRNGDISGGIELCSYLGPGMGAPWRDIQIEHAKMRHGSELIKELDQFLQRLDLRNSSRVGAVRLAGHFAEASLAPAIEVCWNSDKNRINNLSCYLWAFAECCADDPAHYLGPVCDAWAALSDQPEKDVGSSPRDSLASHEVRWAFHKWPPIDAIQYFIERAKQSDLRWPITYMLQETDHPDAINFIVQELAVTCRELEETDSFSMTSMMVRSDWRRAQEQGRPMSKISRAHLLHLWQDKNNDKHTRSQAFYLWAATQDPGDIEVLRAINAPPKLADSILFERAVRGDQEVIPKLIQKLASATSGYWWQCCRYVWSSDIYNVLDENLKTRGYKIEHTWGETVESDWKTSELVMGLPECEAEQLLLSHWNHLQFSPCFIQAALYVATPRLQEAVGEVMARCKEPAKLLIHLGMHWGIRMQGRKGVTSVEQIHALKPYLGLLTPMIIGELWDECNRRHWYNLRREIFDGRLEQPYIARLWDVDRVMLQLDKAIPDEHSLWLNHWIDDSLKTGISWTEILETMKEWLAQRRTLEALQLVASAIEHFGTRENLSALVIYDNMPKNDAAQLVADTQYAVCRRSIR
jgi:hypothetical protein